ncbi:hypothetical protein PIROE2DRAFT_5457 [Piromyces sp. E2]|nr:hypothetical protein PIROE2DRAFT_5457 [Piromyces sp. E2]|eukprot:OUM67189.1 hypothetical protein PIROE2DRAFT_5457 [Piromyces sp. E2]
MDKKIELDLINCTIEQCRQFAKQILDDEFEIEEIRKYFDKYINRDDYSKEDAIIIMRNLVIIRHNINKTKIEYMTCSDKLLLKVSKSIKEKETISLKILYGLFLSQINKEHSSIRDDATDEVFSDIYMRFFFLNKEEEKNVYDIRRELNELLQKSSRFKIYSF